MLCKTQAIVLHTVKHGDSGLIVKLYTESHGLQSIFIRSTQSKRKGSSAALYQPLTLLDIELDIRDERSLQKQVSARAMSLNQSFLNDPIRSCLAMFMAELFYRSIQEGEESKPLFALLEVSIVHLSTADTVASLPLDFLLSLAMHYGIYPDMSEQGPMLDLREGATTQRPPGHNEIIEGPSLDYLRVFEEQGFQTQSFVKLNKQSRRDLLEGMLLYFQIHIPHFRALKSYSVIRAVFDDQ